MKRLACVLGLLWMAPSQAESIVVSAARLVDVVDGRVIDDPVVVIRDGRIAQVATKGTAASVPADAQRIDLGDRTLVPGLIDMHVHLTVNPLYAGYRGLQFTDTFWVAQGAANAAAMLRTGFTTVRNVGARDFGDVGIKQAIEEGLIPGPRIVPAGNPLGATGGHCDNTLLPPSLRATTGGIADSADQLRKRVREQRKYGAEVIKVCATGGVFSRNTLPGQQQLTEEELRAIADEAHMLGLRVAAHAHGAEGIKAAIRAGIDTIEHASFIDAEGMRLAKQRGTWLSMDIYNTEYVQAEGAGNGVLAESLRKDREVAVVLHESFRKAHAAGVRMVFGSDAGVMPHETAVRQFATMVRLGMRPIEAIQSATRNAAQALGREQDVGAIAAGRYADLIAVDGDPTQDVRLLERVSFVMKGGVVVVDPASEAPAETVVISAGSMVDVLGGRVISEPQIVITGGRIVAVGRRGASVHVDPQARRIDLGSMTLLPGLIDMHVHLSDHPAREGYRSLPYTDSFWVAQGVGAAKTMLDAGFTTVRNLGRDLADVGLKQAIDEGLIVGPRIVPSAYQLGPTGGHCDYGTWLPPSYRWSAPGVGDSPDELRRQVRAQRKNGAEVIKVCATGGVFTRNPGQQQLSDAELSAVVREAHMWGLRVAAHAHGVEGIKASIRAGVDTVEHASFIDDEGIKLASERGTWLSMDIYNTEYVQAHGAENGVSANSLRTDRDVAVVQRAAFRKAHAAGLRMVYGTDVGGSMPHELAARQFATLVANGMTALEAIQSATRDAALALGRERDVGAIEAGRFADLIAVRGDPTRDIRLLEQVTFVMKGGKVVRE